MELNNISPTEYEESHSNDLFAALNEISMDNYVHHLSITSSNNFIAFDCRRKN